MAKNISKDVELDKAIGKRIESILEERGDSAKSFSEVLGVSQPAASRYLKGERSIPVAALIKISDKYGVSIDHLVSGIGMKNSDCPWN